MQESTPLRRSTSLDMASFQNLRPFNGITSIEEDRQSRPNSAHSQRALKQYIPTSDPIAVRSVHQLALWLTSKSLGQRGL